MRLIAAAVFFLTVSLTHAQSPGPDETIFPSDAKDPRQAGGAELLQAVCPGAVVTGKSIACNTPCPDDTDFAGNPMSRALESVTFGHFLSPTSEDAALWITGCESHASNFGGAILLTRKSGKWSMLWYKSAIQTATCHKVTRRDRREILVCIGTSGAQGNNATTLYVEDLLDPRPTLMAGGANDGTFFGALDDTATCGWQAEPNPPSPLIRSHIDRIQFSAGIEPGADAPSITVFAGFGKKQMTREEVRSCIEDRNLAVLPPMKSYRMDFQYSGSGYKPAPASVDTVRVFEFR
jgi:hypothetical protein